MDRKSHLLYEPKLIMHKNAKIEMSKENERDFRKNIKEVIGN